MGERAGDRGGWSLLASGFELEGWWIGRGLPAKAVIGSDVDCGMHGPFCAGIEPDFEVGRLHSGQFDIHDWVLHLGAFAYRCLRLLGRLGLTGEVAPIRHAAEGGG